MSVHDLYEALIVTKKAERDPAQEKLLERFDALEQQIVTHRQARRASPVGWLFGSRGNGDSPRGLYIHGDVGRGKTMLMDMFFAASAVKR